MTQVRLSIELGVSQETVSAYENGKHYPSVPMLIRLSELLHASCDYLLGLSDVRCPGFSSALQEEEQTLLTQYRALPRQKKEKLLAYLDGLSE